MSPITYKPKSDAVRVLALMTALISWAHTGAQAEDAGFRQLLVYPSSLRHDTVYFSWSGRIAKPMAAEIRAAFAQWRAYRQRIVLQLSSGGGSVREGWRVIKFLQQLRKTHTLDTMVVPGRFCGSMCIPIYLQGQIRYAARSSTWLLHEVGVRESGTRKYIRLKAGASQALYRDFYKPAGVSDAWLKKIGKLSIGHDYWQTGNDLITSAAGIIHVPLRNHRRRFIVAPISRPIRTTDCAKHARPLRTLTPGDKAQNRNAQGTDATGPVKLRRSTDC